MSKIWGFYDLLHITSPICIHFPRWSTIILSISEEILENATDKNLWQEVILAWSSGQAAEWEIRIALVCRYLKPPHLRVPLLCCWLIMQIIVHFTLQESCSLKMTCSEPTTGFLPLTGGWCLLKFQLSSARLSPLQWFRLPTLTHLFPWPWPWWIASWSMFEGGGDLRLMPS